MEQFVIAISTAVIYAYLTDTDGEPMNELPKAFLFTNALTILSENLWSQNPKLLYIIPTIILIQGMIRRIRHRKEGDWKKNGERAVFSGVPSGVDGGGE